MANDKAQILITAVDQTKTAFDSIRGNLGKLGSSVASVKGVLAGLGVSLSAVGFAHFIKGAIDAADDLNKLSQKIGISVEALSTLKYAAQLSDVSLEDLQRSVKALSTNLNEANTGIGDGAALFKALHVELKNADGSLKTTDEVLLQIATAFSGMEDGATKSALAVKLFGKSGLEMIPLLNQGAAGISQLTAEAERLGLKLTTETARSAEEFNDNLIALKNSAAGVGIEFTKGLLPGITRITEAMRQAAVESGLLKALWVGLKGLVGETIGTSISSAQAQKLPPPEFKSPVGKPSEDVQRIACVVSGGHWINGKCEKSSGAGGDPTSARMALVKAEAESELKLIKEGLDQQKSALDRSLDDRLVSFRDYANKKTRIEQASIDQEIKSRQEELSAQQKIATTGKDEITRLRALTEVKKLESEITVLNMKRSEVEVINAHTAAKAEKELALALEEVRRKTRELSGMATNADSRAAIANAYQPLIEQLRAMKDAQGEKDVLHLIDVESDLASLALLETKFKEAMASMQVLQDGINIKRQSGLLTEAQARSQISDLLQQTANELDVVVPKMEALAAAAGGEAVTRVAGLRNEVARLRVETDQYEVRFEGAVRNSLQGMFNGLLMGQKDVFSNMVQNFKAAVAAMIAEALAAKLMESLFSSGFGISSLLSFGSPVKKADGGLISGPGTGTSDSIPALLSDGEYVVRSAAVKHFGVSLLDSLNSMQRAPVIRGNRLAFASGGLVQAPRGASGQASAPANIVLSIHPDALHMSMRDWLDGELARTAVGGR